MPEDVAEIPKIMRIFDILKRKLGTEEYLIYLNMIAPMIGNVTAQLRDITKKMSLKDMVQRHKRWKKQKHNPCSIP